jgi:hypothetical protein
MKFRNLVTCILQLTGLQSPSTLAHTSEQVRSDWTRVENSSCLADQVILLLVRRATGNIAIRRSDEKSE